MPKRHAILPVKDVNQAQYVRRLGHYLKKSGKVSVPEWVDCVKTGYSRELPPNNPDWLYIRMAAVARRVYMRCPSGVGAISRRYGGRNSRRGVRPARTATGAKKIIRFSMQQFEKMGWMRKAERGRKLTKKGRQFMDEFSGRVQRSKMVTQYYKRIAKEQKAARKAVKAQKIASQKTTTQGGPADNAQNTNQEYVQTQQNQDTIVQEDFDQ